MKDDLQDIWDLCRLNQMEENIQDSSAIDRDVTLKAIDYKKRQLVNRIKPAKYEPGAIERHLETNTVDGQYSPFMV